VNGRAFGAHRMRFIAHGLNAAGIDPAIVKVEQGADGDGVVNDFVSVAGRMQEVDIGRADVHRFAIHFSHKPHERFFGLGEQRCFEIGEDAVDQLFTAEQFRRDRGVRFRSKRAVVQVRGVSGDQLTEPW